MIAALVLRPLISPMLQIRRYEKLKQFHQRLNFEYGLDSWSFLYPGQA